MADIDRLPGAQLDHWEWQGDAACRGMDSSLFFHPPNERAAARDNRATRAKAICRSCPVIAQCLNHALRVREPYGVWGGRTEDERAQLLGVQSLRYPALIRNPDSDKASRRPGPVKTKANSRKPAEHNNRDSA